MDFENIKNMYPSNYDWDKAEEMLAEGYEIPQIAKELNCKLWIVNDWAHRYYMQKVKENKMEKVKTVEIPTETPAQKPVGISKEETSDKPIKQRGGSAPKYDWNKAMELHKQGKTDKEICEAVGCGRSTIAMWRKSNNLHFNGTGTVAKTEKCISTDSEKEKAEPNKAVKATGKTKEKTTKAPAQIVNIKEIEDIEDANKAFASFELAELRREATLTIEILKSVWEKLK